MSKTWKFALYLLLFGILTLTAAIFGAPTRKEYTPGEVAGAKTNLSIFVEPEAGETPIVEAINEAQKEILVVVYLLSDDEVLTALEVADARGVGVKVMIEENPFGGGNINETTAARLQGSGIEFKFTNPTFALTHQKTIIIDRQMVFILNQNITESAFDRNREFNIIDYNPAHVLEAVAMFEADWERKGYTAKENDLVVSPDNSRDKLTSLLKSAKYSIDSEAEVIEDDEIAEILSAKAKTIPVRIIIPDLSRIPSNKIDAEKLISAGVQVKTLSSPYMHAKLILVDGVRGYSGSINFTGHSMDLNRELGILFSQGDIIARAQGTFEEDWLNATDLVKIQ